MIHQVFNLPTNKKFIIACSGGVDSMAILDFYRRGNKFFEVAYFDHDTGNATHAIPVIKEYVEKHNLTLHIGKLTEKKPIGMSPEHHWRNQRYGWLSSFQLPVITAHHLQDLAETYLFHTMHGTPRLMSCHVEFNEGYLINIYRPFILTTKESLIDWCKSKNVNWYEDNSNTDITYPRNRIRHRILPEVLKVNPGFLKNVKKRFLADFKTPHI